MYYYMHHAQRGISVKELNAQAMSNKMHRLI